MKNAEVAMVICRSGRWAAQRVSRKRAPAQAQRHPPEDFKVLDEERPSLVRGALARNALRCPPSRPANYSILLSASPSRQELVNKS